MNQNQERTDAKRSGTRPSIDTDDEASNDDRVDLLYRNKSQHQHQHQHQASDPTSSSEGATSFNFPSKLHKILSTPEYMDIICWLPHGRAWRVQQQDRLESEVLPKFFKHKKYTSFARQVYGWGFNRIPSGPDYNAFYHELFLRDDPDRRLKMKRPSKVELAEQRKLVADSPPNFYAMSPVSAPGADAGEAEQDASYSSSSSSFLENEYRDELLKRLSTYSMDEQRRYLEAELNDLDKRRSLVRQKLQLLQTTTTGGNQVHGNSATSRAGLQLSFPQSLAQSWQQQQQQQLPDPRNLNNAFLLNALDPWVQRAAQELLLEQQMRFRNAGADDGRGNGGANSYQDR